MIITEKNLRNLIREILIEKKMSGLPGYSKNTEMELYPALMDPENSELRDEVFNLVDLSYAYLPGGNVDIKSPDDLANPVQNDYIYFKGWDLDSDPEPDVIRGMKPKSGGVKLSLSATDGSAVAKQFSKQDTINRLKNGHWAEMSGRSASMAMKAGVPAVTDKATAIAMVKKPDVVWHGEHPFFKDPSNPKYANLSVEAQKSKTRATFVGQYDGWYERKLGSKIHVKMVFGG